jgi:hypothetical protein
MISSVTVMGRKTNNQSSLGLGHARFMRLCLL